MTLQNQAIWDLFAWKEGATKEEISYHRARMELLLTVPALITHSTLRYAAWRQMIAEFVASAFTVLTETFNTDRSV